MIHVENKNCCGCSACFNVCPVHCIRMEDDAEGFKYPTVDTVLCLHCKKCENVCPIISPLPERQSLQVGYAAIHNNEEIRLASSSGGVFTALADVILAHGGVVCGAAFSENSRDVQHIFVESTEAVEKLRGSKYLQSFIDSSYKKVKEYLVASRPVLFSGTPCQVEGLLAYLKSPQPNLYCVNIICHGVPSPRVWREYLDFQEKCFDSSTVKTSFRHKKYGWKRYSLRLLFNSRSEYLCPLDTDPYMQAFLKDLCLRPSCYFCKFKKQNSLSDITIADLWGVDSICPELDDDKGTSAIIVHSEKGASLLQDASHNLTLYTVPAGNIIKCNPAMIRSASRSKNRKHFMEKLGTLPFDRLVLKYAKEHLQSQLIAHCIKFLKAIGLYKIARTYIKGKQ